MYCTRKITEDIYWIGGNDRRLSRFENIFPIPRGVSYNSYVILDEKTVLLDTVDYSVSRQFIENLEHTLDGRGLDYIVVNHMEPDHCAVIGDILLRYPNAKLVGNAKTFNMIGQFYEDMSYDKVLVAEGDTLSTGTHTLRFLMAPMVHWPETMVTYDENTGILFSADAFGTFGALDGIIFADEVDFDRDWLDDARRYYTNIVGKYGVQVQALLKKAASLDIKMLAPLHGPVWRKDLEYILDKYNRWSTYEPEDKGIMIAYASMYGNTENMANALACMLAEDGVKNIRVYDVSGTDVSTLISEAFRVSHIVLASPTYNGDIYPVMESFIKDMKALNIQNRTVALMDNGTWAATASKKMAELLGTMKNITVSEKMFSVKSTVLKTQTEELKAFKDDIAASMK